jgi:hypothetical protein
MSIELYLGDFIKIKNNENKESVFYVDYIDSKKIELIDVKDMKKEVLLVDESGYIGDGSIESITLLHRNEKSGYANQNELLPNTWIEITFSDEEKVNGYIISLEDDVINVKIEDNIIYINFEYKGLPEGISGIKVIDSPVVLDEEAEVEAEAEGETEEDIIFEKELNVEVMYENVNKKMYRYSLEEQLNDLMNVFILKKVKNPHLLVARYKYLREKTSLFDENGNIIGVKNKEINLLKDTIMNYELNLNWIQYVSKVKRNIYCFHDEINQLEETKNIDIELIDIVNDRIDIMTKQEILGSKSTGLDMKYKTYYDNLHIAPFSEITNDFNNGKIESGVIKTNSMVVLNNYGDFKDTLIKINNNKMELSMGVMSYEYISGDVLDFYSLLSYPKSVVLYTNIKMPMTNIMVRSNYSRYSVKYWEVLGDIVERKRIDGFNGIMNIMRGVDESVGDYLERVLPKVDVILKNYIDENVYYTSIKDLVKEMEPFMIYLDGLNIKDYEKIKERVETDIKKWINKYKETVLMYDGIKKSDKIRNISSIINDELKIKYDLTSHMTIYEIINKMTSIDYGRYNNIVQSIKSVSLMTTENLLNEIKNIEIPKVEKSKECIMKKYENIVDLVKDDGYDIKLEDGKVIKDGDYAFLGNEFYTRHGKKWEKVESNEELCNTSKNCLQSGKTCVTMRHKNKEMEEKIVSQILSEFDVNYQINKQKMEEELKNDLIKENKNIEILKEIRYNTLIKTNINQYNIGEKLEKDVRVYSPYIGIRDLILSEQNFVKKQIDLINFVETLTRVYNINDKAETNHWLYCKETNTELLPRFYYTLAKSYVINKETYDLTAYKETMEKILEEIGATSGGFWIDKYSGFVIKPIDFSDDNGYEDGFKIKMNEVVEEDVEIKIKLEDEIKRDENVKKMVQIIKVMNQLLGIVVEEYLVLKMVESNIGLIIPIPDDKILNKMVLKKLTAEEQKNDKLIKKLIKTKIDSIKNQEILILTLSAYIISIQVQIPSIRIRKIFYNCGNPDLTKYPLNGNPDDLETIQFVLCVLYNEKEKMSHKEPFNELMDKNFIMNNMIIFVKNVCNKIISDMKMISEMINEKNEYLLRNKHELEFITNKKDWTNFLPPLHPIKVPMLDNISTIFENIKANYTSNNKDVRLKIISKVIHVSLIIQENIQNIVVKEKKILKDLVGNYFIDNACCNEIIEPTVLDFFDKKCGNSITGLNKSVVEFGILMKIINKKIKNTTFLSIINTKLVYPVVDWDKITEEIMIYTFIHYCHFESNIPEDIIEVCPNKIELLKGETLFEKVKDLGITKSKWERLLKIIGKRNIINTSEKYKKVCKLDKTGESNDEYYDKLMKIINDESVDKDKVYESMQIENTQKIKDIKRNINTKYFDKTDNYEEEITPEKIQFLKDNIKNIVVIYPEMIKNGVELSFSSSSEWGKLALSHIEKIRNYISEYYNNFNGLVISDELNKKLFSLSKYVELTENICINNPIGYYFFIIESIFINIVYELSVSNTTYINIVLNMIYSTDKKINIEYDAVMESVFKQKEKEKNNLVRRITNMNKEERSLLKMEKYLRLGEWYTGKGNKLILNYNAKTYDMDGDNFDDVDDANDPGEEFEDLYEKDENEDEYDELIEYKEDAIDEFGQSVYDVIGDDLDDFDEDLMNDYNELEANTNMLEDFISENG